MRDYGPGVPAGEIEGIFEPFVRASNTGKSLQGHGLGLAIAKRILATHGGTIAAENAEGGGLRVTIRIPLVAG